MLSGIEALRIVDRIRRGVPPILQRFGRIAVIRDTHRIRKTYAKYRLPDDPPLFTQAGKVRLRDIFLQHAKATGVL
jgi:hypothetical protein